MALGIRYIWRTFVGVFAQPKPMAQFRVRQHSEIHKWLDPRTTPPNGQAIGGTLPDPIRTKDNQDSYWLGVRTTSLR